MPNSRGYFEHAYTSVRDRRVPAHGQTRVGGRRGVAFSEEF